MESLVAITPPGGPEWIIILAVVVLLFGAKKLPELGSSVGKSITNFKSGMNEARAQDEDEEQTGTEEGSRESGGEALPAGNSTAETADSETRAHQR